MSYPLREREEKNGKRDEEPDKKEETSTALMWNGKYASAPGGQEEEGKRKRRGTIPSTIRNITHSRPGKRESLTA